MDTERILETIAELAGQEGKVFLVGGAVRDRLLRRACHDLDFIMPGETYLLARKMRERLGGDIYVLDRERDTTRVLIHDEDGKQMALDFASLQGRDLLDDLRARDFTMNAMAIDVKQPDALIDPCGGAADLEAKRIRACLPTSVSDDPVRSLRAIRQAVALNYAIEAATLQQVRAAAALLPRISAERLRDELVRTLEGRRTALALRLMERSGLLEYIFPELLALKGVEQPAPHVHDVWAHTLEVVARLEDVIDALGAEHKADSAAGLALASAALWLGRYRAQFAAHLAEAFPNERSLVGLLKFAALYHDAGKPETGKLDADGRLRFLGHQTVSEAMAVQRARALVYSNQEVERIAVIVREHMRVHALADTGQPPTRKAIFRFFRDAGVAGIDVCLLSLADTWATYSHTLPQEKWLAELRACRELLEAHWEKHAEIVSPPRLVNGGDLMRAFDLKPGKLVGELLAAIQEAQASGDIQSQAAALAFAARYLAERETGVDR